jgi:hypothetical protein
MDEDFMNEIERSESDRAATNLGIALKSSRGTISKKQLRNFCKLVGKCGYNSDKKEIYRKLGQEILKAIVLKLGLKEGEYRLSWNPGGIAISGDHVLHTEKFYLALEDNCDIGWGYYRKCNGSKDYSGERNISFPWSTFPENFNNIVEQLQKLQFPIDIT